MAGRGVFRPSARIYYRPRRKFIVAAAAGTDFTIDQTDSAGLTDTAAIQQELVRTDSTGLTDTASVSYTHLTLPTIYSV